MKSVHLAGIVLILMAFGIVLSAGRAQAQFPLSSVLWSENISLEVDNTSTSFTGSNPESPEPQTETLSDVTYEVTGSVGFNSDGPPKGTAEVTWNISELGRSLTLSSQANIDFQCRVVETDTPPATVTEVPVHLLATGQVSADEIFGSRATASFRFQAVGTAVLVTSNLDISGDAQTSDSFSIDETPSIPPDTIVLVSMMATASMNSVAVPAGSMGSAMGVVDPIIEVVDETIPGTSSSYRDYFTVEFSPGYDRGTPVERTSFGDLKQRYVRED